MKIRLFSGNERRGAETIRVVASVSGKSTSESKCTPPSPNQNPSTCRQRPWSGHYVPVRLLEMIFGNHLPASIITPKTTLFNGYEGKLWVYLKTGLNSIQKQNKMILIDRNRVKDVLTPTPKTPVWTSARTAAGSGASRRKQRLSGLSDSGQSVGPVVSQWEGLNPCRVPLCAVCMISPKLRRTPACRIS